MWTIDLLHSIAMSKEKERSQWHDPRAMPTPTPQSYHTLAIYIRIFYRASIALIANGLQIFACYRILLKISPCIAHGTDRGTKKWIEIGMVRRYSSDSLSSLSWYLHLLVINGSYHVISILSLPVAAHRNYNYSGKTPKEGCNSFTIYVLRYELVVPPIIRREVLLTGSFLLGKVPIWLFYASLSGGSGRKTWSHHLVTSPALPCD